MLSKTDRAILALALPSIVSNITTPLLGLMDVAFTGHMGSATYLAAIAVGGTVFNMIYWIFGFLRMGTSGMTAQAFGRSGADSATVSAESCAILLRGLTVALAAGLLLIALRGPVADASMALMDTSGATAGFARRYFAILSFGAPAVLATYVATGWLLGMQNARSTMWMSLIINVANLAVSFLLVVGFGMKIEGVAVGTLVAQWAGAAAAAVIILRRYRFTAPTARMVFDPAGVRRFFSVNADIFLRTLCLVAVTVWFTRTGASQGTIVLAVNTLMMQFFMFFSYFMDGFAFAGEALTGRFIGARDRNSLRLTVSRLMKWGAGLGLLFSVIYFAGGNIAVEWLTSERDVISASAEYMVWVAVIPLAGFASFTYDGIFIGATLTRRMLLSMAAAMAVYFAVLWLAMPRMGNHGLWLAFILYLITRGAVLHLSRRKVTEI